MPAAIIVSVSMVTVDYDTPFIREAIEYVLQFELLTSRPKKRLSRSMLHVITKIQ